MNYAGTISPADDTYRLGGGGGTLTLSAFGELAWSDWFGRDVNNDSILVRFTYQGDADINGEVTTDDKDLLMQVFVQHSGLSH